MKAVVLRVTYHLSKHYQLGSSSRLDRRRKRPIFVTRGSFRILNNGPSDSLSCSSSCATFQPVIHGSEFQHGERALVPSRRT